MQLQRGDRQNLVSIDQDSDNESFQCKQTLQQSIFSTNENRVKQCGCRCRCNYEDMILDPLEKKRQKRKQSKRRQKEKQKLQRQKALKDMERIIRDIYAQRTNFRKIQGQADRCLNIENNRDRVCDFINIVIRQQVQIIRKEIRMLIEKYQQLLPGKQDQAVREIFAPIRKIAQASEEIQKLINLFVQRFSDEEDIVLQKNFGPNTLNYIKKNDLQQSIVFRKIRAYIFEVAPEMYPMERELVNMMTIYVPQCAHTIAESEDTEEGIDDYYDEEEEWEEELSTIESQKGTIQHEHQHGCDKKKKKKRQRKRKLKEDIETDFEAICKRTEQMEWEDEERLDCHVTQQFLVRMRKRKWKYLARQE